MREIGQMESNQGQQTINARLPEYQAYRKPDSNTVSSGSKGSMSGLSDVSPSMRAWLNMSDGCYSSKIVRPTESACGRDTDASKIKAYQKPNIYMVNQYHFPNIYLKYKNMYKKPKTKKHTRI